MPQSRREQSRARHEAKRKKKRKSAKPQLSSRSKKAMLRAALAWPVMECWVNEDWKDPTQINQVVVTRRNPATGEVYVGTYLVDRACLGVKDAYASNFSDARTFRRELLTYLRRYQKLVKIDFNLAAKIVRSGIEYAAQFGFRPHRVYQEASILLQDADLDAVEVEIPVGGPEGKPFFIAGPYDNADKIMGQLLQKLGPGGFNYLMPVNPEAEFLRADDLDLDDAEYVELPDDEFLSSL